MAFSSCCPSSDVITQSSAVVDVFRVMAAKLAELSSVRIPCCRRNLYFFHSAPTVEL